jgi:hypothetical protein
MPGIVDPAFGSDKPGDNLLIGINRNRSFQEMFSSLAGSGWVIVTWISAGKPGWIDRRYVNRIVVRIKQIQSFSECVAEVHRFYPAEEFLKRSEVRYDGKIQFLLDRFHVFNVFNEITVVLVPVVFEENQDKKLVLREDLFWIFAGIRCYSYCFHDRNRSSDKPDIPARRSLNCLLTWRHIKVRRHCTLDLSVIGIVCFG